LRPSFLYELVDVEELRERLELIAGDAHWREVLHFLLSALIENNRITEILIAVEVLEGLNEGDDDLRLLRRRLGRGAVLTARLLQEGVLEEDKRIRQPFQKCLSPLTSTTEIDLLKTLIQVGQPDSQSWLQNFLISCLQDQNFTESIGAATVLSYILPDESNKVEKVFNFLLLSPSDYLSVIMASGSIQRNRGFLSGKQPVLQKDWFITVVIRILLSSQWFLLTEDTFASALEVMDFSSEKAADYACKFNLSEAHLDLFTLFLKRIQRRSRNNKPEIIKKYSFVEVVIVQSKHIDETEIKLPWNEDADFPGVLKIFHLLILFIGQRKRSILIQVLKLFTDENIYLLDRLIARLDMTLPIDILSPLAVQIKKISLMSQEELDIWSPNQEFRFIDRRRRGQEINLYAWRELINDYPYIAIHLWGSGLIFRSQDNTREALNILAEKLLLTPKILESSAALWGSLLKELPEREVELRTTLLQIPSEIFVEQPPFYRFQPFELHLPSEATLLPYLVNAVLNSRREHFYDMEDDKELKITARCILEMIGIPSALEEIFDDSTQPNRIRSAAIIAYLFHPNKNRSLEDLKQLIVKLYIPKTESWYVQSLIDCLCLTTSEEDLQARWIINNLLESARADYKARQYIDKLLSLWRESSHAPVQKAGIQEKWLSGSR
jgi:hypothetical protein